MVSFCETDRYLDYNLDKCTVERGRNTEVIIPLEINIYIKIYNFYLNLSFDFYDSPVNG